jgi:hypothetical protein
MSSQQTPARKSAQVVVPLLMELVEPKSVIDIGCGDGTWLAVCKDCGVDDIYGVDGDWIDKDQLAIPRERFLPFDLHKPFRTDRQFDLVLCLEVAQDLPFDNVKPFIHSLTRLGPVILFSSGIPFQRGVQPRAVNEQWPEFWVNLIEQKGFQIIDCLRKRIWQNDYVDCRYIQNLLLFAKREFADSCIPLKRQLSPTRGSQLALVHPRLYQEVNDQWVEKLRQTEASLATALEKIRYQQLVCRIHDVIHTALPSGCSVIVVSRGDEELLKLQRRKGWHFPQAEHGEYAGYYPVDSAGAIAHLEALRARGADFLLFPSTAFWWLDYYKEFKQPLDGCYPRVWADETCVIYRLSPPEPELALGVNR